MNVLQIHTRYLEPGGEDGVVGQQAAMLRTNGHQVATLEFENPSTSRQQLAGLASAAWNPSSVRKVRKAVEANNPDVIHVHNTWYAASPAAVWEAHRTRPTVMTVHNYRFSCLNAYLFRDGGVCNDCVGKLPWRGIVRRCYRDSTVASGAIGVATALGALSKTWDRSIDRFLVLSDFAADVLAKAGISQDSIGRMDNFVADPGERLARPSSSDRVLAVGRLSPEKGFFELLDAWSRNRPQGLVLTVVGDGPERARLESLDCSAVEFVGRQNSEQVQRLMLNSRALLFPSRWYEGQPLVLLEAMAAGLPVLSSDRPPLRELLEPAGQLLVEDNDWPNALDALVDSSSLDRLSDTARAAYLERFTEAVAYRKMIDVYDEVR